MEDSKKKSEENECPKASDKGKNTDSKILVDLTSQQSSGEAMAKPVEPSPMFTFKKSKETSVVPNELSGLNLPESYTTKYMPNGSMQAFTLRSRAPDERALSPPPLSRHDAVQPAAMSGSPSEVKGRHHHTKEVISKRAEFSPVFNAVTNTIYPDDQQPAVPVSISVKRIKRPRRKHNSTVALQEVIPESTPQSPPPRASSQLPSELTAAEQGPKPNWLDKYPADPVSSPATPDRTIQRRVKTQTAQRKSDNRPRGISENLCTPEEIVGQGRKERTPCPPEMNTSKPFKPTNTLNRGIGSTATGSLAKDQPKTNGRQFKKPFDLALARPPKRQRTDAGNHAGSSATSPVDVDDHSNTARSENSNVQGRGKSVGSKENQNHRQNGFVSGSQEYRDLEELVNPSNNKRGSVDQTYPSKKRCLRNNMSSKEKISSRMEDRSRSTTAVPKSMDLDDDPIEEVSARYVPGSYTGNARPSKPQQQKISTGTSPFFTSRETSRPAPTPSSRTDSTKKAQLRKFEYSSSADELAPEHPNNQSKAAGSRDKGAAVLKKYSIQSRGDIRNTVSRPSKSGNTRFWKTVISSFVAGDIKWGFEQEPGVCYLVFNSENKMLEPYKDETPMAREWSELVVDPTTIWKIRYSEDCGGIIYIYRRSGSQKASQICFQLGEDADSGFFMKVLSDRIPDVEIHPETSEMMNKLFNKLFKDPPMTKTVQPGPEDSQEFSLLTKRAGQRQLQSQQDNNKASSAAKSSGKKGLFGGVTHGSSPGYDERASNRSRRAQTLGDNDNDEVVLTSPPTRRSTRQDQRIIKEPSPPPVWTQSNPKWRKQWGLKGQLSYPHIGAEKAAVVDLQDIERLDEGQFLNDNLIAFYLRYLREKFERDLPEVAKKVYFHNTFFYKSLTNGHENRTGINYDAVKKWTSKDKVDLFSKDFIVVPVNESTHWYLAIIYNAPALTQSDSDSVPEEKQFSTTTQEEKRETNGIEANVVVPSEDKQGDETKTKGESDLPPLEKLQIHQSPDDRSRDSSHDDQARARAQPTSGDSPVASEGVTKGAPPLVAVPDSQPSSPKENPSRGLSVASRHSPPASLELEGHEGPEGPSEGTGASASKTAIFKKKKAPAIRKDMNKTHVLILDSLGIRHPATIANLKEYMISEAKEKLGLSLVKPQITGMNARGIPLQNNGCDCGLFLLGYVEQFLKGPVSFIRSAIETDMTIHWGDLVASEMRTYMRKLIYMCKENQDGIKRVSPRKDRSLENGKTRSSQASSREGSERVDRSRRSPNSPGEQLRNDLSRPTSAGSQTAKMSEARGLPSSAGTGRDAEKADEAARRKNERGATSENSLATGVITGILGLPNVTREATKPSSPVDHATPSIDSRQSSVLLEEPLLAGRRQKTNTASTPRPGSPKNPITFNEDEIPSSSPGTLPKHESAEADHIGPGKQPARLVVEVIQDSQEEMLLDNDDFLANPEIPSAVTDKLVTRALPDPKKSNGTSAPATTPIRPSGKSIPEATPSSSTKGNPRPVNSSNKGKHKHRGPPSGTKPIVVD